MTMTDRSLNTAEKHAQARAFALSGSLSKFQLTKLRKAREKQLLEQQKANKGTQLKSQPPTKSRVSSHKAKHKRVVSSATVASYQSSMPSIDIAHPITFTNYESTRTSSSGTRSSSSEPPPPPPLAISSPFPSTADSSHTTVDDAIPWSEPLDTTATTPIATITATNDPIIAPDERPKEDWEHVTRSDWQYVYICEGPFSGKFGYYDDHDDAMDMAKIYFGMPVVGDGPYRMPLEDLRVPPHVYCHSAFTAM